MNSTSPPASGIQQSPPREIPKYARPGAARLPRGGPDRVRFCVWYGEYIAEGKSDAEARASARGCLFLMYAYVSAGIGEKLGAPGGVPLDQLGEE